MPGSGSARQAASGLVGLHHAMLYRLALLAPLVLLLIGTAYRDQPPVAHTGGFGENTCLQCHFDGTLNAPGGSLALQGTPEAYAPGAAYPLTVTLARPEMQRGGFQLSVRYAGGAREGRQAGTITASGDAVVAELADGVQYISHTEPGTSLVAPDSIRWTFAWRAPEAATGSVLFHVAANAANGDDSEFGDYIYALEVALHPSEQSQP